MITKTIWKYEIKVATNQIISLGQGAEILCVQTQNDIPYIWVLVVPDAKFDIRLLIMHGTGHPIIQTEGMEEKYIGTFQLKGGLLVYHLFEQISKK